MPIQIESGAGNRDTVVITADGRLNVSTRTTSRLYYQSRFGGRAYTWTNASYDYTAADTIVLIKNTHALESLVIHAITMSGDTTSEWEVHTSTANITPAGTTITAVNTNLKDSIPAQAIAMGDETANTQGNKVWHGLILANTLHTIDESTFGDAIRLGTNHFIGVDVVTDGAAADVTIIGYFETDSTVAA